MLHVRVFSHRVFCVENITCFTQRSEFRVTFLRRVSSFDRYLKVYQHVENATTELPAYQDALANSVPAVMRSRSQKNSSKKGSEQSPPEPNVVFLLSDSDDEEDNTNAGETETTKV